MIYVKTLFLRIEFELPYAKWQLHHTGLKFLTHWGRVTHICVSKLTIIGSDNGLSPDRRQAIIWTNAGILSIGTLGTNFSEILIEILTLTFKKMRLKVSAKRRPFCLGLNVLMSNRSDSKNWMTDRIAGKPDTFLFYRFLNTGYIRTHIYFGKRIMVKICFPLMLKTIKEKEKSNRRTCDSLYTETFDTRMR